MAQGRARGGGGGQGGLLFRGGLSENGGSKGSLGLGLTQRSKYVFVLSIIPSYLQLEDVEWEDWE